MRAICAFLCAGAALSAPALGQVVHVGDSTAPWLGFMNVSDLPENGGVYQFGSPWAIQDLVAVFDDAARTLTLSPNTIGDPNEYWYQGGGGPGAPGNKIMEASLYQEVSDGSLSGVTVTFEGTILANSFTGAHETVIFIRDFAADYSSFNETAIVAAPGAFSISLNTLADPTRHVQWGFRTTGVNVWVTDTEPFGSVVVRTVPTPGALAVLGLGGLAAARRRRA